MLRLGGQKEGTS